RRPVQPDRRLPGTRGALYADRVLQRRPYQLVLLGLDGGHDVAHRPDPGPLDLLGQDPGGGTQLLAPVQVLVLEAGQRPGGEAEPAAYRHPLRVAYRGPVERPGQRRPPVQHHRLAGLVHHVPPTDVVDGVVQVELAEEQRGTRVVGQFGHPPTQRRTERLRAVRVPGHLLTGREQVLRVCPHPG